MQLLAAKFNAIATEIDTTHAAIAELQASRARARLSSSSSYFRSSKLSNRRKAKLIQP